MALAPPPGTIFRSRCFRISTGASRDTREISPKTNSSATRSARTVTVNLGKEATIFRKRSFSLICLVINVSAAAIKDRLSATQDFLMTEAFDSQFSPKLHRLCHQGGQA